MHRSLTRWTTAAAAAALIALPPAASAQTPPPPDAPPVQQTDPKPAPQTDKPAQQPEMKVDAAAAKLHLSKARDTLSQLTSMPEAARLQGDARTQVTQLISNFNELITTQAEWKAAYAKVDANLSTLLGPETPDQPPVASSVSGAVGTSGTGAATLDPAIRAKLVEFRTHLKEFERSAGGGAAGAMAPSIATGTTANPDNPAANPPSPMAPPAAAPAGAAPPSAAATMVPADQAGMAEQINRAEADKHLDAISAILDQSKTGALTRAQTSALKKHVVELRALLQQGK